MTDNFNNLFSVFSLEDNPVLDTARKAGDATRDAFEGVTREQFAATGELIDLGVTQFEALTGARDFGSVAKANQAWLTGTLEVMTQRAGNTCKVLQDAAAALGASPIKPARKTARKATRKAA